MYISTSPIPEIQKFSNENVLPRRGSNPGSAEQEADILPSEPARRARIISSGEGKMMVVMGGAEVGDGELGIAVSGSGGQDSHGRRRPW